MEWPALSGPGQDRLDERGPQCPQEQPGRLPLAAKHDRRQPGLRLELRRAASHLAGQQSGERRQLQSGRSGGPAQHQPAGRPAGEQRRPHANPCVAGRKPGDRRRGRMSASGDRSARSRTAPGRSLRHRIVRGRRRGHSNADFDSYRDLDTDRHADGAAAHRDVHSHADPDSHRYFRAGRSGGQRADLGGTPARTLGVSPRGGGLPAAAQDLAHLSHGNGRAGPGPDQGFAREL